MSEATDNGEITSNFTAEAEVTRFVGLLIGLSVDAINLGTAGHEGTLLQVVEHHLATLTQHTGSRQPHNSPPPLPVVCRLSQLE